MTNKKESLEEKKTETSKNNKETKPINFKEKYLLAIAEQENLRKRLEVEKNDIYKFKISSLLSQLLPTIDMFDVAINNKKVSEEMKSWLAGFEMINKSLKQTLFNEGVKEVKVKIGDQFNSELHHAIGKTNVSGKLSPGQIAEIKLKGYYIHDRLLRPASVIVVEEDKKTTKKGE